jgi:hypothetical protein
MNCFKVTKLLLWFLFSLLSITVAAQEKTVSGKVTDADGKPIQGVTVKVKNTTISTVTNVSGDYTITAPSSESLINFSHVSYTFQEKKIGAKVILMCASHLQKNLWRKLW